LDFLSCFYAEFSRYHTLITGLRRRFHVQIKETLRLDADTEEKEILLALDRVTLPFQASLELLLLFNEESHFRFNGIDTTTQAALSALRGHRHPNRMLIPHSIRMFNPSIARTLVDAALQTHPILPAMLMDFIARRPSKHLASSPTELGPFNGPILEDITMLVITMLALITRFLEELLLVIKHLQPSLALISHILTLANASSIARTLSTSAPLNLASMEHILQDLMKE